MLAISCRKASPLACSTWGFEILDEAEALQETANAYGADPTPANCRAYRDALQDYVNELERYRSCSFTAADQQSWNEFLDDAQQSVDDLNC